MLMNGEKKPNQHMISAEFVYQANPAFFMFTGLKTPIFL